MELMEPSRCSSLFLISCEAVKTSESDLHRTSCQLSLPTGALTCAYLPVCAPQNGEDQVQPWPVRSPSSPICPFIHLNLPFHPTEAPLCQRGRGIKAFRMTLQRNYPFYMSLNVSCFCRSLSERQIVCHNRSFSLYLSFVKIQLQARRPSFIIILAAFYHAGFKPGCKFPCAAV